MEIKSGTGTDVALKGGRVDTEKTTAMTENSTETVIRATWLSRRPSPGARMTVAWSLAALTLGTSVYWRDPWGWADEMPATRRAVFQGHQIWRLWTSVLAHADLGHFAANSLLFVLLGYFLAGYFGARVFPFGAFLFAGLVNGVAISTYPEETRLLGASGMVCWMGGAWLALYLFLNRQISPWQRLIRAAGVAILLFAPSETYDPKISYRTHLIGFVVGILCGGLYFLAHRRRFRSAEVTEILSETEFNTGYLD